MGQYSQWLYHREVDQQLRERLELLEQELHALQEQAVQLEVAASNTENPILQAIAMQQSAEALLEDTSTPPNAQQLPSIHRESEEQVSKSMSSALFAWSHLPNLDTQKVPLATNALGTSESEGRQHPPLPYPEVNLLPSDMATFIDTHQQILPQTQPRLPKWLRHTTLTAHTTDQPNPKVNLLPSDMATFIDTHQQTLPQTQPRLPKWLRHTTLTALTTNQQKLAPSAPDEHTDASIRRWLQRWGKQLPDSSPTQKPQEVYKHE